MGNWWKIIKVTLNLDKTMNMNFKKKLIIVIYNLIIGSDDIKNGLYTNFKVHIDFLSKNEYFLCVALLIT